MSFSESIIRTSSKALKRMASHPEALVIIAYIFSSFLSMQWKRAATEPEILFKQAPPKPVFNTSSNIPDFYMGHTSPIEGYCMKYEVVFVMYYAPWCRHSLLMRSNFQEAKNIVGKQVHFISVNCWEPNGECRQHMRLPKFPTFVAYRYSLKGYIYHGPSTTDGLVSFLLHLLKPVHRVSSTSEALTAMVQESSVLCWINTTREPQPPALFQYWAAALRFREVEPIRTVQFLVYTDPEVLSTRADSEDFHLQMFAPQGGAMIYKKSQLLASELVSWVQMALGKLLDVVRLSPSGDKSEQLWSVLQQNLSLVVFAPQLPAGQPDTLRMKLRELYWGYSDCDPTSVDLKTATRISELKRRLIAAERIKSYLNCSQREARSRDRHCSNRCCLSMSNTRHQRCELCAHESRDCSVLSTTSLPGVNSCVQTGGYYNVNEHLTLQCKSNSPCRDPLVCSTKDTASALRCRLIERWPSVSDGFAVDESSTSVHGASCGYNRTLTWSLVRSHLTPLFAHRLGLRLGQDGSAAVLIDLQNEEHFLLHGDSTKSKIASFVSDFMNGTLVGHRRSSVSVDDVEKHVHPAPGVQPEMTSHIVDLTASNYEQFIYNSSLDVLVMHYTPWCVACRVSMHVLHSVALHLSRAPSIRITRIDHSANDLAWKHNVFQYPTVQLFPAYSVRDGITFPLTTRLTVPSLLKFIWRHASRQLTLKSLRCSSSQSDCLQQWRSSALTHLSSVQRQLAVWQNLIGRLTHQLSLLKPYGVAPCKPPCCSRLAEVPSLKRHLDRARKYSARAVVRKKLITYLLRSLETAKSLDDVKETVLHPDFIQVLS